jgi:hypothetical protein
MRTPSPSGGIPSPCGKAGKKIEVKWTPGKQSTAKTFLKSSLAKIRYQDERALFLVRNKPERR